MSHTCEHKSFEAQVSVNRLDSTKGGPMSFMADVQVRCAECLQPFQFLGLPAGVITGGAAVSVDGLEARLAICPQGSAPTALDTIFTKTSTAH